LGHSGSCCDPKQRGTIDRAKPLISKLIDAGMFLDHDLLERVLSLAGE
jgi:predicted nucleic acid-binding protein